MASAEVRDGDRVAAVVTARRQPGSGKVVWVTLLSQAGLLITLKESGGIPARHDMAGLPDVTNNPLLAAYTSEVKDHGAEYPPEGGAAIAAQAVIAQNWSAAIAGQKSPSQAAADASSGVKAAYHP